MNEILFLRFFTALATTNADDPDIHAANDYAISLVKSNRAALTRAEAAEAEAYERLEAALFAEQRATDAEMERDELAARVAELEAERAAQQWRPGNENPPAPDWYQVGDIGVGVYNLWYSGEAWHRSSFQGATYRTPPMSPPNYWRPIPPLPAPPAAPEATE